MPATAHPILRTFLWLLPTALEIGIVLLMLYRGLLKELPIFFAYVTAEIGRTAFLFAERKNAWIYFFGYWITEFIACLLALCVFKELFDHAFSRHLGLRKLGAVLFKGSLLVLIVSALLWAWVSPATDSYRVIASIILVKRTVTFVQAGLLGLLFVFAFGLGLPWNRYVMGVALGFGLYGAMEMAAVMARNAYGHAADTAFSWIMLSVGNCCILVWALYFLFPAPVRANNPEGAIPNNGMLKEWNDALMALLRPGRF
ncbi:MAG TPA: hypothetical protein VNX88_23785 [Terriglobales bacterium]|jgi:hypothetical protein|nr:hypothetical protein [Terriglobales bacterium]